MSGRENQHQDFNINHRCFTAELAEHPLFVQCSYALRNRIKNRRLYRESFRSFSEGRLKAQIDPVDCDPYLVSEEAVTSYGHTARWLADHEAVTALGDGSYFLRHKQQITLPHPGEDIIHIAALRRPTEHARDGALGERMAASRRLGIQETALMEGIWGLAEGRELLLDVLANYESTADVPAKKQESISNLALVRLDTLFGPVERDAFGRVLPNKPKVFRDILAFWNEAGIPYLAARETMREYGPGNWCGYLGGI